MLSACSITHPVYLVWTMTHAGLPLLGSASGPESPWLFSASLHFLLVKPPQKTHKIPACSWRRGVTSCVLCRVFVSHCVEVGVRCLSDGGRGAAWERVIAPRTETSAPCWWLTATGSTFLFLPEVSERPDEGIQAVLWSYRGGSLKNPKSRLILHLYL